MTFYERDDIDITHCMSRGATEYARAAFFSARNIGKVKYTRLRPACDNGTRMLQELQHM